jgi:hypothetical protein
VKCTGRIKPKFFLKNKRKKPQLFFYFGRDIGGELKRGGGGNIRHPIETVKKRKPRAGKFWGWGEKIRIVCSSFSVVICRTSSLGVKKIYIG